MGRLTFLLGPPGFLDSLVKRAITNLEEVNHVVKMPPGRRDATGQAKQHGNRRGQKCGGPSEPAGTQESRGSEGPR